MRNHRLNDHEAKSSQHRKLSAMTPTMRKAAVSITLCGVVAAAFGVGFAQDPFSGDRFSDRQQYQFEESSSGSARPKLDYFSRKDNRNDPISEARSTAPSERSTAPTRENSQPQTKRYVRGERPAPTEAKPQLKNYHRALFGTPPRRNLTARPSEQQPRTAGQQIPKAPSESAIIPAGLEQDRQLPDPRKSVEPPFGEQPRRRPVISEDYRRRTDSREQIQPVRATDEQRASGFKSPAELRRELEAQLKAAQPKSAAPRLPMKAAPKTSAPKLPEPSKNSGLQDTPFGPIAPKKNGPQLGAPKLPSPSVKSTSNSRPRSLHKPTPAKAVAAKKPAPAFEVSAAPKANFSQATPVVTLKWVRKSAINVGQKCRCDLVLKNTNSVPAMNVEVTAFFPKTVRLVSAKPVPEQAIGHLVWNFPSLPAGAEKTIEIAMIPSRRGEIATTANVRFTGTASAAFKVEEPMLRVAMKGPAKVMVGDPASQIVTISNPGTGIAENVQLEVQVPKGLEHIRGERLLMEVGSLNPGETRAVRLSLAAVTGGTHTVQVEVKADAALSQSTASQVNVIAPSLKVAVDGPGLRYVGRSADYTISVANDGQIPTNNVRLSHKIADGFEFVSADRGGKFDPATSTVSWFVGRLEASQQSQLKVRLKAKKLGEFQQLVQASSEHGARAQAQKKTMVDGTASLILEIVDLDDPVEVGAETAYEIRVRNSGTKAASRVGLSCELPEGVELLSAKGPVKHIAKSGMIVFQSLKTLDPGKTALFRVHVRGSQAGNQRFRTHLTSNSVQEPLVVEELTKFYAD